MTEGHLESQNLIPLIYETAEDVELWPKLLSACKQELLEGGHGELADSKTGLLSHLQRALRMNLRMEQISQDMDSAQQLLNYLPMAVITVNGNLEIISKNRLAESVLVSSGDFCIRNGRLHAKNTVVLSELKQIIDRTLKRRPADNQGGSLKIESEHGALSVFVLCSSETGDAQTALCTLFFASNAWSQYVSADALKKYYKLTGAEARLSLMLASGQSLGDISATLKLSHNTLRNQLKSVFSKTGTSRQAELVALIMSTPANVSPVQALNEDTKNERHSGRDIKSTKLKAIVLRDGRHLNYRLLGDPKGIPVIYHHDAIAWDWWNLIEGDIFSELGIFLVHPFRPGFNGTDLHEKVNLKMWAEDLDELLNYLNIDTFYAIGNSSGSMFAAASAYFLGERCIKLSLVNSMAPIDSMSDLEGCKPAMSRLLLGFARYTPTLYRTFFQSLLRTISRNSTEYLRSYISNWSEADQSIVNKKAFIKSIVDCFNEYLKSSKVGITFECILAVRDWGFQLTDIQTSTDIWHGGKDLAIAPKLSEKLLSIPSHRYHNMSESGHLMILDHARAILGSLTGQSTLHS